MKNKIDFYYVKNTASNRLKIMSKEELLVPHRRFKEFQNAGAWEQHKLGEVAVVNSGRDYKHLSKGNIPVYGTGGYMLSVDKSLSEKDDGIGIGRKGTINKPYILRAPFWTVDTLFYVIPTTTKLNFLYGVFQKIDWLKKDESTGVPSLSKENINKTRVWIPKISEQKKIGSFLKQFDHLITLHQRKLNKLKRLKSAYLTEMFPAEGERKPKRRFTGFNEAWEQHKLGELGNITTGNTPKTSENNYWSTSGFVWITPSDIKSSTISDSIKHLSNLGWEKARKVPAYSLLVTCIASIGKNTINVVPAAFNQQINALVPVDNDVYFLLSLINQESSRLSSIAGQTATAIINKKTFEKFDVVVPKLQEQKKMGKLFSKLDNLITLHQRKIDKLKKLKAAYLNEMFV